MIQNLFPNIGVKNLMKSRAFFEALGFHFNEQFSDDKGACLVLGQHQFVMLLTPGFMKGYTHKPISYGKDSTEVLMSCMLESKEAVNEIVDKAVKLGAKEYNPANDLGFMYTRVFEDFDGHQWEWAWMDTAQFDANE